ncbi:MAG: DUF1697 domain-containing protein [Thermoplasmata archaeon]|nr:DUF1697 domain-containing protein [Thermoplasmata archaeon]
MSWAVFLRGANVGGKVFRPTEVVRALPALQLVSIGAAGTFAVMSGNDPEKVRRAIAAELPFDAEILVVPTSELRAFLTSDPLAKVSLPTGARRFLTVTARPLDAAARLPMYFPDPDKWEVQILAMEGRFVAGMYRRLGPRVLYPNAVIERTFKVAATTRWWETVESVHRALSPGTTPEGEATKPARSRPG